MKKHLRGNRAVRLLALLLVVAFTLTNVDTTALAAAVQDPVQTEQETEKESEAEAPADPEEEVEKEPEAEAPVNPEKETEKEPEAEAPADPEEKVEKEPEAEAPADPEEVEKEPEAEAPADPEEETEKEPETTDSVVTNLQACIDALPTGEEWLAMDTEQQESVYNQAQSIADELEMLSEEEQAQLNLEKLQKLFEVLNGQIQTTDIQIYGSSIAESGKLVYLNPTVLRPDGEGKWSSGGNILWFGKEIGGTPMQYRILSSTDACEDQVEDHYSLLLDSVKQIVDQYGNSSWWGSYKNATTMSQLERGAIASVKYNGITYFTPFELKEEQWKALYGDDTISYGQMLYIDLSKVLMVSKIGAIKDTNDSKLYPVNDSTWGTADNEKEWKLTLLDTSKSVQDRSVTYVGTATDTDDKYQMSCTYWGEENDQLSVMVTDKPYDEEDAQILCYGHVNPEQKTGSGNEKHTIKGTFLIDKTAGVSVDDLKSSYHVYLIVESISDQEKGTNYASKPYEVQVGELETHLECGYTDTNGHEAAHPGCYANQCTFTPWNRTDSLPTEQGNYYLVNDVELDKTWSVPGPYSVYLCLSGHNITMKGDGPVIEVPENANFYLTDCKDEISGGVITHVDGAKGYGIEVKGYLQTYKGKITGNKGGGVYVNSHHTNTAGLTVNRDTVIEGNTAEDGTTPKNVYLCEDQDIYVRFPGEGMRVGITTAVAPSETEPVKITENGEVTDANYIFSDQDYDIEVIEDKKTWNNTSTCYNLCLKPRTAAITAMDADGTASDRSLGLSTSIMHNPVIPMEEDTWKGNYVWFGYDYNYNGQYYKGKPIKYRVLSKNTNEISSNGEQTLFLDSDCWKAEDVKYYSKDDITRSVEGFITRFSGYTKKAERAALVVSKTAVHTDCPFTVLTQDQIKSGRYGYSNSDIGRSRTKKRDRTTQEDTYAWWLYGGKSYVSDTGAIVEVKSTPPSINMSIATNVNIANILFSEVAAGKAGELNAEYKLTMLAGQTDGTDNMKVSVTENAATRIEDEVSVSYELEHDETDIYYRINQVSVVFLDKEYTEGNTNQAKLLGYVKVDDKEFVDYPPYRYDNGLDGAYTRTFQMPDSLRDKKCGKDYYAYIIAEQINGEQESNFSSTPVQITIPKGSYRTVHTVVNPDGAEATYNAQEPIDVTQLFQLDSRLVPYMDDITVTYELVTGDEVTGVGALDTNNKLNVTKCGTLKIKVSTSAVQDTDGDDLYAAGEATATLTVNRAAGSMEDVKVANTDSGKTDITYGDSFTASTNSTTNNDVTYTYWLSSETEADAATTAPTAAGTYTVKAVYAATDLYNECSKTAEFTILPKIAELQWSKTDLIYTGNSQSVTATVRNKAYENDSFTLEYSGNAQAKIGSYTATVTALGNSNYTLDGAKDATQQWNISYLAAPANPIIISGTKGENDWYVSQVTLEPAEGYQISTDNGAIWQDSISYSVSGTYNEGMTYMLKQADTGYLTEPVALPVLKLDLTAPTGKVQINKMEIEQTDSILWKWFFKEKAEITVTAEDAVSGVEKLEYQSVKQIGDYKVDRGWKKMDGTITIPANDNQILYFKITDKAGNETILNANSVVVYTDATASGEVNFVKTNTLDQDTGIHVWDNTIASIIEGMTEVESSNYVIQEIGGQNHLVLKASYLKSLTDGTHIFTVAYNANGLPWDNTSKGEKPADSKITVMVSREKGVVTITNELTKEYDGNPVSKPEFITENARGTDDANVTIVYKVKGTDDSTYTKTAPKNYGTYEVRVTVAQDDSHTEATAIKEFSITRKPMKVAAEGFDDTYDGFLHGITVKAIEPVDEYTVSYSQTSDGTYVTTPISYKDAGEYTVYYRVEADNYEPATGFAKIQIAPKTVTLQWGETTFIYNGKEQVPTATVAKEDLCGEDTCAVTKVTGGQKNAGTYTATAEALDHSNYKLPDERTTAFVIEKASVTVQAEDAKKHIDSTDPKLTYKFVKGQLAEGDSLNGIVLSRTEGESAGIYEITALLEENAENPNYMVTVLDTKATFTIEDHDQSKVSAAAVEPTCTKAGSTEERSCSVCGKVMVASVVLNPLGHDWSGDWKVISAATATETGRQEKICTRKDCGQMQFEVIPATGQVSDEDQDGQMRVNLEIASGAPIPSGGIYNTKKELLDAPGIFDDGDKTAIQDGAAAKVWVEITQATLSAEEKDAFEQEANKTVGNHPKLVYFSAELFCQVGTDAPKKISEPGTKLRLTIRIPDELLNTDGTISREYFILRMHNGEVTLLNGTFDKDTKEFTFETDRFSDYALVCKDTKMESKPETKPETKQNSADQSSDSPKFPFISPKTGDQSHPLALLILAVAVMGMIEVAIRRKKR